MEVTLEFIRVNFIVFFIPENVIGRVQLGSFMFARGRALEHWNQMMARKRDHVLQWHTLT